MSVYPKAQPQKRRDIWNAELLRWGRYEGKYEMPSLPVCTVVPRNVTAFTNARADKADDSFIHYYEDDYKFERVWRNPHRYLPLIKAYGGAIAPDFSVYREMPLSQQVFNVFKSRTLGFWWTKQGIPVIPNVRWGDERTYEFCFDGLPQSSVIAIGTHGCAKRSDDRRYFFNGFMVMLERLKPTTLVVYGSASDRIIPRLFVSNINIVCFESDFALSHRKAVR